MKQIVLLLLTQFSFSSVFAQSSSQWTWMNGDSLVPQYAMYGTRGVAAASNKPGARQYAVSWTDATGNMWVFGGAGYTSSNTGYLDDLWMYSPSTAQWIWTNGNNTPNQKGVYGTQGVAHAANKPGARQAAAGWPDASGNLWLFGGFGYNSIGNTIYLNDLWKYAPSTGQWTWMGGDSVSERTGVYGTKGVAAASNHPGSRQSSVTWTDAAGNLWLFGGRGYAASGTVGFMNDLWKYTPATSQWTWISGENTGYSVGVYGTKGVANSFNKPGARHSGVGWADASGSFWLFGGLGNSASATAYLNDLWKYEPSTDQWTWMSGSNSNNMEGMYGIRGTGAPANSPGARIDANGWTDAGGNLWLFGGSGYTAPFRFGTLNDFWRYNTQTNEWAWMSGDSIANQAGTYGVKGITAPGNNPKTRMGAVTWHDLSGNFWLFAGSGSGESTAGNLDDLWKYAPQTGQWTWVSGNNINRQTGSYGIKGTADPANIPGARVNAVSWTDSSNTLWLFGGSGFATVRNGYLNDLWKYNPSNRQWTWMGGDNDIYSFGIYGTQGVASPSNKPGARFGAVNWTDAASNLWLFGGTGHGASGIPGPGGAGSLNDLWKYSPSLGQWTWMSGGNTTYENGVYGTRGIAASANKPGSRYEAVSWTDAQGNLWLFGGGGNAASNSGTLNDMWKYDPVSNQWTWMNGDSTIGQRGIYGTQGIPAAVNKPGARYGAQSWTDGSGNLWLFGGVGYTDESLGGLNDLWKYDPSTAQWAWMAGDKYTDQTSVYGRRNIASPYNKPGSRQNAVSWTDAAGNFWLFGGSGYTSNSSGYLNDLWNYNPSLNQWTWVSGDDATYQTGVYGTKNTADSANKPGSRLFAMGSTDASRTHLWLFGGSGYASHASSFLNDLWQFTIPLTILPVRFNSFTAQKEQQTVRLNWITSREQNSRNFIIERSSDGAAYDSIGYRAALPAAQRYAFTDHAPLPGPNFYRIRQVDNDGRFMYSTVQKVVMRADALWFSVTQNPVQTTLQLYVYLPAAQKLSFQVRDLNGHLFMSEERRGTKGRSTCLLAVDRLAKGAYLISVQTATASSTKFFIKQ